MGELPDHAAPMRYRADIDGLRAVAVIAVVVYHAFPKILPGGFIGVDVFFVISGYLITSLIVSDLDGAGFRFAEFYARRVRRIFPALIAVLFATLAAGVWIFLPSELSSLAKNTIASALFGANLMLLSESGYFDIAAHAKPLLHLWSLGIEEQFYLAWPLALWLTPRRWRTAIIAAVIIGSFGLNIALVKPHPDATFYLPFTRVWELIVGAALVGLSISSAKLREILSALSIAGGVTFYLFDATIPFPGWAALVPVVGASLVILSEGSFFNRTVLSHPIAMFMGRISYPLYLWHWPLLVFARFYFFRPLSVLETIALVIASVGLAWLTYEFIEKPIRSGRLGGVKTALIGMPAAAVFAVVTLVNPLPLPDEIERFATLQTGSLEWRLHECMLVEGDRHFATSCIDPERPLVALWGDSAAGALMPGLRDLQSQYRFGIAQFTVSGCPPLIVKASSAAQSCLDRNREALQRLAVARPKIVLLHSLWWSTTPDELKPTVDALRSIGVGRIILLGKAPVWLGGLPDAAATYYRRTHELLPERTALFVDPQSEEDRMNVFADSLGMEYISLRNLLCDEGGCLTRVGADLIVSDWLHFTPAGSKYVMKKIGPAFLGAENAKSSGGPDSSSPLGRF
jgi:peptidoglycan/LPS O-acetylase OafA/YrhL